MNAWTQGLSLTTRNNGQGSQLFSGCFTLAFKHKCLVLNGRQESGSGWSDASSPARPRVCLIRPQQQVWCCIDPSEAPGRQSHGAFHPGASVTSPVSPATTWEASPRRAGPALGAEHGQKSCKTEAQGTARRPAGDTLYKELHLPANPSCTFHWGPPPWFGRALQLAS